MNFAFPHAKKLTISELGVWENNIKAINLYKKVGFEFMGEKQFIFGNDI